MVTDNFFGRFSSDFRKVLKRFLECSFHLERLSSWLAAFSFALEVLFLPLTSFTVYPANHDCLSSSEFLILLIWYWMYSNWFFFVGVVCVSSLLAFLSFWSLSLVVFLLLSINASLMLSRFPLTAIDSHGTLHLLLGFVYTYSTATSIWTLTKFYIRHLDCLSDIFKRDVFLTVT